MYEKRDATRIPLVVTLREQKREREKEREKRASVAARKVAVQSRSFENRDFSQELTQKEENLQLHPENVTCTGSSATWFREKTFDV